jgi:hypothetical protein
MEWIRITLCGAVMLLGMLIWLQAQFAGAHSTITLERHTEVVDKIEGQLADGMTEKDRIHLQGPSDFVSEVLARTNAIALAGCAVSVLGLLLLIAEVTRKKGSKTLEDTSQ